MHPTLEGIRFLFSLYFQLVPIQLVTYALLTFAETRTGARQTAVLTKYSIALGTSLLHVLFQRLIRSIQIKRDARKCGAELPAVLPAKRVGGIDLLTDMLHEAEHGYFATHLTSYFERMGRTFCLRIIGDDQIITIEPDYIKRVLATEFNKFEKGRRFREATQAVLGVGVFNADDDMWKFHRTMTRPFFTRERISDFELYGRHADTAISKLKSRFNEKAGPAIDFQDLVSRFTLDSATEFLFGSCVHSLSASLPYSPRLSMPASTHPSDFFATSFTSAQNVISQRTRIGYTWPLWEMFNLGNGVKRDMSVIKGFIGPIVEDALKEREERKRAYLEEMMDGEKARAGDEKVDASVDEGGVKSVPEGETLLGHLVKETDDKDVIADETINILIAGRDTTAALLTFTIYMLTQHPSVCQKLREEILEVVGPNRMPNYDDVRKMKYLRAVLNETLRLFPPVPFDVRSTREATVWPSKVPGGVPLYIPSDTPVIYSAFIMHRWKPFWGPDALEFDPDRFIDERLGKYLTPNPFIFLPFNAGPRICLGQQFAYNESSFFLIRLLQSFSSFTLATDSQPEDSVPPAEWKTRSGRAAIEKIFLKSHLTMNVKGGLWVRMTEANESEVA